MKDGEIDVVALGEAGAEDFDVDQRCLLKRRLDGHRADELQGPGEVNGKVNRAIPDEA